MWSIFYHPTQPPRIWKLNDDSGKTKFFNSIVTQDIYLVFTYVIHSENIEKLFIRRMICQKNNSSEKNHQNNMKHPKKYYISNYNPQK